jgi:hypothetical protein
MQCAYHQDRNGVVRCSVCQKPLCTECAIPEKDGTHICNTCVALKAAQDIGQEVQERDESKAFMVKSAEKEKEMKRIQMRYVGVGIVVLIVVANLILYFSTSEPQVRVFEPREDAQATALLVDTAIRDYQRDHNGRAPASLSELKGSYLPEETISPAATENITYSVGAKGSYRLDVKGSDDHQLPQFSLTQKGLQP